MKICHGIPGARDYLAVRDTCKATPPQHRSWHHCVTAFALGGIVLDLSASALEIREILRRRVGGHCRQLHLREAPRQRRAFHELPGLLPLLLAAF